MKQPTVLIIDDDIALADEIQEILEEHHLSVELARTRHQFDEMLKKSDFDLFVVDLLLPDGHGHDIVRAIRADSHAGIIVLTGKPGEVDTVISLELGADDYVVKPFSRSEFVARVNRLLRRLSISKQFVLEGAPIAKQIEYGPWLTDLDTRKVTTSAGDDVQLTKLEYDLWIAFLQGVGRVLTRDQLILAIRGRDWAGYDRSIDGLISRLRKKLSESGDIDEQFETVRGVGYLLREWPVPPSSD